MDKIQEAYLSIVESSDRQVSQAIEKLFGIKVKNTEEKRKITFHLSNYLDDENMDNWSKIDALEKFIKSKYKGAIVEFQGSKIVVEEL